MSHLPSQKRRRTDAVSSYRDELLDSDEEDDSWRITEWVATTSRHVSAHVTRRKHNTSYFSGVDLPTVAQSSFYGNDKDLETDIYAQAEQLDPAPSGFEEDGQGIDDDDSEDDSDGYAGDDNEQDDNIYIADYLASVNGQSKTSKRVSRSSVYYDATSATHLFLVFVDQGSARLGAPSGCLIGRVAPS